MKNRTLKSLDDVRLDIDPNQLIEEWCGEPRQVWFVAKMNVKLHDKIDRLEGALDLFRSELALEVRANPADYDLPKTPTETAIQQVILTQSRVQKDLKTLQKLKSDLNLVRKLERALETRARALDNAVRLWIKQYYSEPSINFNNPEEKEAFDQLIKQQIRNRTKKTLGPRKRGQ